MGDYGELEYRHPGVGQATHEIDSDLATTSQLPRRLAETNSRRESDSTSTATLRVSNLHQPSSQAVRAVHRLQQGYLSDGRVADPRTDPVTYPGSRCITF